MKLIKSHRSICIDPGTTHSGVVIFDGVNVCRAWQDYENEKLVAFLARTKIQDMAIEGVASYGMAVGQTTFETVEWIGRFREAFGFENTTRIYRKHAMHFLCGCTNATGANIRQRILDIFPATGGEKTPQKGIKSNKGPLYEESSHSLSAFPLFSLFKCLYL